MKKYKIITQFNGVNDLYYVTCGNYLCTIKDPKIVFSSLESLLTSLEKIEETKQYHYQVNSKTIVEFDSIEDLKSEHPELFL